MKMQFNDLEIEVTPTGDIRQWYMTVEEVAMGYGVERTAVMNHLQRHADEIRDGIEKGVTNTDTLGGSQTKTVLFRDGVIKLGFFIRSRKAAHFRQWATELITTHLDQNNLDLKDVIGLLTEMKTEMRENIQNIDDKLRYMQGEVDELRELLNVVLPDSIQKELRDLIRQVKIATSRDGRTIVGEIRSITGFTGIYNTSDVRLVKNILRKMLGGGLTSV